MPTVGFVQLNNRLASLANVLAFLKGGNNIAANSEEYNALGLILDAVSCAIANYCLPSSSLSWLQQSYTETFGDEHYGRGTRNKIRLGVTPIVSITSVIDNIPIGGSLLDASEYVVNARSGILTRLRGKFYCGPESVQVIYIAGYAASGSGDTYQLLVPPDLSMACMEQVAYEFGLRQPGGQFYGTSSVARPDGSLVSQVANNFLPMVTEVLNQYRMKEWN